MQNLYIVRSILFWCYDWLKYGSIIWFFLSSFVCDVVILYSVSPLWWGQKKLRAHYSLLISTLCFVSMLFSSSLRILTKMKFELVTLQLTRFWGRCCRHYSCKHSHFYFNFKNPAKYWMVLIVIRAQSVLQAGSWGLVTGLKAVLRKWTAYWIRSIFWNIFGSCCFQSHKNNTAECIFNSPSVSHGNLSTASNKRI